MMKKYYASEHRKVVSIVKTAEEGDGVSDSWRNHEVVPTKLSNTKVLEELRTTLEYLAFM